MQPSIQYPHVLLHAVKHVNSIPSYKCLLSTPPNNPFFRENQVESVAHFTLNWTKVTLLGLFLIFPEKRGL